MIAVLISAAVLAAPSPDLDNVGSKSGFRARQTMQALGECFAAEETRAVQGLLAQDFRRDGYGRDMRRLLGRRVNCGSYGLSTADKGFGALASGTLLWGGALAEGLLKRNGILSNLSAATAYMPQRPNIEARNSGEFLAFCAIRKDAAGVARLLQTMAATGEEYAALQALAPTFSGCLPQGGKAEFTRESLRALMATGAYRLALHNAGVSK